jgi:tetraacyldisaccharide 4'-kinase
MLSPVAPDAAHDWLQRVWYEGAASGAWLAPLGWSYRAITSTRRALYASGMLPSYAPEVPVIVVGNLTVGGTGKTPLVIWLTQQLVLRGWRPGIVSRGYGGSMTGPALVTPALSASEAGDEPLLIAARTHRSVVVARDRVAGARLLADCGVDVVIADDGVRRFGNGRLLPAGPLRESPARIASVDAVVTNGGVAQAGELQMRLEENGARALLDGGNRPLQVFSGQTVHAVAGIGHPQRFFATLRRVGIETVEHAFPDHHALRPQELEFGDARPVLMTEKDAVKCRSFARDGWWAVPVSARFDERVAESLMATVLARLAGSTGPKSPER